MLLRIGVTICWVIFASGCSSISYYGQSIIGHSSIMLARQPVEEVMKSADETLKKRLATAIDIRQFAVEQLSLPDNKSYTTYVQLKNDTPVWNVIAATEFSLGAKQWCYPIVGCASYRGYYHKEAAEHYAQKLKEQGYEVAIVGATAYSTLGWFADPLTSAMFNRDDASLAELIFHELAHQQMYVKGDSRFNEAFASAIGEQGAIDWLQLYGSEELLATYKKRLLVKEDFLSLINEAKRSLSEIYNADTAETIKREKKHHVFLGLYDKYLQLKAEKWNDVGWYDRWFNEPINNARLVSIATYRDLVPDFNQLFFRCDRDYSRFYSAVEKVASTKNRNLDIDCQVKL